MILIYFYFSDINSFNPQITLLKIKTLTVLIFRERKLRHRKANVPKVIEKWYVVKPTLKAGQLDSRAYRIDIPDPHHHNPDTARKERSSPLHS